MFKNMSKRTKWILSILVILALTSDIYVDHVKWYGEWIPGRILLIAVEFDYFRGGGRR